MRASLQFMVWIRTGKIGPEDLQNDTAWESDPMIRSVIFVISLAASGLPAMAQDTSPNTVVVEGRSVEEAIRDFVAEIGVSVEGNNLARWDGVICVGAHNITPAYAQALIDRVSLVAVAVGLEPGEPGCKPNVLIMAHEDGKALATRLVQDHRGIFDPPLTDGTNLGRQALDRFRSSDAPVRWWHRTQTVMADTGAPFERGSAVRVRGSGRVVSNLRQDLVDILIILDTSRMGSVSFDSLSDYVSMIALAQLNDDPDTREFPSVLNLFAAGSGERKARLTNWDLDYLASLYGTSGDAPNRTREANRISRAMLQRQAEAESDKTPR